MAENATSQSNPEHDHLLYELETSDTSSVGLVLRAIYDGDEHRKFMERLDARIKNHDRDIERMCNFHYQGFIDSIQKLLLVRTEAERLRRTVKSTDDDLQRASRKVVQMAEDLVKHRKIQHNIERAIENLSHCLPVLEMYGKLSKQMKEKRYYPALKTLEQLEHTYLPRVSHYRFAQTMRSSVPLLRDQIKVASMSDLKDFLENIRKCSPMIGKVAMKHASEQQGLEAGQVRKKKKKKAPPPPNPFTGEIDDPTWSGEMALNLDGDDERSAQDLVDFSPVYRCLHIYSVLGARDKFETYYRDQREEQARLALAPPPNMEGIEDFRNFFSGIIGFFVVEDHILNTADGLVNRPYLDEVWEKALSEINVSLRTSLTNCEDADLMLDIKKLITLFSYTLQSYGYQVSRLNDLLLEIRNRYSEFLMKEWVKVFEEIFDEDDYRPVEVESEQKYQALLRVFPFNDDALVKNSYPRKLPFSTFVPKVFAKVKEFIAECLKFCKDLNLSQTEIEDMVRKSTNQLLKNVLSDCLNRLIEKPNLGLLQLIQVTINTNYLEDACVSLEEYISKVTGSTSESSHVGRLQAQSMFKATRKAAENKIYIKLNKKIDEFLDLADYDWLLVETKGHASEFLTDLVSFLNTTFEGFTNLDDKVAYSACLSVCAHLASKLMKMILDKNLKYISMGAIEQFNLDVIQCEQFATSQTSWTKGGGEDGEELQICFSELRQLMDLFDQDWENKIHQYIKDYGTRDNKNSRVSPQLVINLLEKVREADKKKNFFSSTFNKNSRDKKKKYETFLKQLQQLTTMKNGHHEKQSDHRD